MSDELFALDREPAVLGPGGVHLPGWLDRAQQEFLLRACVRWSAARAPRHAVLPGGGVMSVRSLSVGRDWEPYAYLDGPAAAGMPRWMVRAGRSALAAAAEVDPRVLEMPPGQPPQEVDAFSPDTALVNFYGPGATMGLHQDRDEAGSHAVVSLSLGDAAVFRFGTPEHRGRPYTDVRLESGDLVVFGGPGRRAFHGVPKVHTGSAPGWCADLLGAEPGRVNITLRVTR